MRGLHSSSEPTRLKCQVGPLLRTDMGLSSSATRFPRLLNSHPSTLPKIQEGLREPKHPMTALRSGFKTRICSGCGASLELPRTDVPVDLLCEACFLGRHGVTSDTITSGEVSVAFAEALVEALDLREHETGQHSRRVACHTLVLARRFDDDPGFQRQVYLGALLHDIGKIGVPDRILLKQGALDPSEWAVMRRHPEMGHDLLRHLPGMETAAALVRAHEERFDGTGYPDRLRGSAIPLGARLFSLIDALDAMTSDRPYRAAMTFNHACAEIIAAGGKQFDPLAVEVFVAEEAVLREMVLRKCALGIPQ